jgi:hypothetical protein
VWQRHHRIGQGPDDAKRRALQLFPGIAGQLKLRRDSHRADAILIAAYGIVTTAANVAPDKWSAPLGVDKIKLQL